MAKEKEYSKKINDYNKKYLDSYSNPHRKYLKKILSPHFKPKEKKEYSKKIYDLNKKLLVLCRTNKEKPTSNKIQQIKYNKNYKETANILNYYKGVYNTQFPRKKYNEKQKKHIQKITISFKIKKDLLPNIKKDENFSKCIEKIIINFVKEKKILELKISEILSTNINKPTDKRKTIGARSIRLEKKNLPYWEAFKIYCFIKKLDIGDAIEKLVKKSNI